MRPVIIGAGRGSRLQHKTEEVPKTMVPVMGRPMLDWILDALERGGFQRRDVVFICGYAEDVVRDRYPEFTFVRNSDWQNNNILLSLLCARDYLQAGFVSTYADIVYDGQIVEQLMHSEHDLVLGNDTDWRRRYVNRSQHPESDGEKLRADGNRVLEISRHIDSEAASGEFIGVLKASARGAATFLEHFDRVEKEFADQSEFREGRSFQKAYLIDLLQHMLLSDVEMHCENMHGGYMEIDTLEDLAQAQRWWDERREP